MEAWSRLPRTHRNVELVVVAEKPFAAERSSCQHSEVAAHRLVDARGSLAHAFNATWMPRVYLLDERGALLYRQPATTMNEGAPWEVERMLDPGETRDAPGPT